jgi:hypothetical protein
MKKKDVLLFALIAFAALVFYLKLTTVTPNLDSWLGEYAFLEATAYDGPLMMMDYELKIERVRGGYSATLYADGQTTMLRALAEVRGGENAIDIVFSENLPDGLPTSFSAGDVLLRFERLDTGEFRTIWVNLEPLLYENTEPDAICFEKVK